MSWLSGIIGGGIGAMIAGPFGAVIGAALGAGMGGGTRQGSQIGYNPSQRRQMLFFTAAFSMLGKLAKADGRVCENEIAAIQKISQEALGLDDQTRQYAINVFNQAKNSPESFSDYACQFGEIFSQDQQLCGVMLNFLFSVAMADGEMHPAEEQMLREAQQYFHIHDSVYQSVYARFVGSNATSTTNMQLHYENLGVTKGATKAEIKKAYRQKVAEYHPDKIEGKGLPPEFIKFANDKVAELNASYDTVMKSL